MRHSWLGFSWLLILLGVAGSVSAAPVTAPTGLSPGEQYRLAFMTSTLSTATATDIATYNTFVTNVANSVTELADLGTTWTAIASTATVDARGSAARLP